jgi:hypothetical protein
MMMMIDDDIDVADGYDDDDYVDASADDSGDEDEKIVWEGSAATSIVAAESLSDNGDRYKHEEDTDGTIC